MENPSAYIPIDRRQALVRGESLAERTTGAALFADISGFTPLTEALERELGSKRGAEELSIHLNNVYDALIAELHLFGGSVIGFSGDAISCWFDGDYGLKASASALAMQDAMEQYAEVRTHSGATISLGIKTAVSSGSVRRFLVGETDYLVIDAMAGTTLDYLAAAEHQAERGELVLDGETASNLLEQVQIAEWRDDDSTGDRFAVVSALLVEVPESPWPETTEAALREDQVKAWLLPRVHERLQRGQGGFLAELRPAVALFSRFSGIDYESDAAAPEQLNVYIQQVEGVLKKFDGSFIQLTIGDKGSYLYAAFGAPVSHEDDAVRAVSAAREIQAVASQLDYINEIQIGIAMGRTRTGAYGSGTRRTYGVLGDAVNLSARLMMAASSGQILTTDHVRNVTSDIFVYEDLPSIRVKGKTGQVPVSRLVDLKKSVQRLRMPEYQFPMVGRLEELQTIEDRLEQALTGHGQILGITGEAGMGKSRLSVKAITSGIEKGFTGFGGECQSYGTNTSYLVWQNIWRGFFELDGAWDQERQILGLEQELARLNPALLPRLPLLGAVVNLSIPDSELTGSLNAKVRKASLESMLVECLRIQAKTHPIMLVLEDCQWLDPLSNDLIEVIGRSIADLPVFMLILYRPPELQRIEAPRVNQLPYFYEVNLDKITPQEADQLVTMKMAQLYGHPTDVPTALMERITAQAEGNPFYIEELLNYFQDLGIDPKDHKALETIDLPGTIYSLILSRMDQLSDSQQITMKVASVIGRLFGAAMIWGVYPSIGDEEVIIANLELINRLELTQLDTPEPEMTYLFKHIVTQQVAYNSLLHSTRAMLHNAIGLYIEDEFSGSLDQYINVLAHHYEHSENEAKKRQYLLKAGKAAQRDYSNVAAIDYYEKVLPLLTAEDKVDVLLKLGEVQKLIGEWEGAGASYDQALSLADEVDDCTQHAWVETAIGEFIWKQGRLEEASEWLSRARSDFENMGEPAGVGQVLHYMGVIADQQGDYETARALMQESLTIRLQLGDKRQAAYLMGNMGIVARRQGMLEEARELYEESLEVRREIGDRWGVANVSNNLGNLMLDLGDQDMARSRLEEAVTIHRELGDRWATGNALNNLGNVLRAQGEYSRAKDMYDESLMIYRDLGDRWALAYLLEDVGWMAALQYDAERALRLVAAGSVLREQINAPLSDTESVKLDAALEPSQASLSAEQKAEEVAVGQKWTLEEAIVYALSD